MRLSRRHLPSLKSLATFEVAAKHLSFTLAAKELHVTQAAVSQHIRYLEEMLEVSLFNRSQNALELSREGEELLRAVTGGLNTISSGVASIRDPGFSHTVTIASTNASAQLWLYPLVEQYQALAPDTQVTILASDRDDSIQNFTEVDVVMLCGIERSRSAARPIPLFEEIVKPVCSPDYLADRGHFADASSMLEADLLHLHKRHWTANAIDWRPITWQKWFWPDSTEERDLLGFQTNSYVLLHDVALQGRGVMLGFQHLSHHAIENGKLCVAYDQKLSSGRAFYLQKRQPDRREKHIDDFVDFIVGEVDKSAPWELED